MSIEEKAAQLRQNPTRAERAFSYRFAECFAETTLKNQHVIGKFIVDFYLPEYKIIIEIDGGQHCENNKDKQRDQWLSNNGYQVLRYWNNEVLDNLDGVMTDIETNIKNIKIIEAAAESTLKETSSFLKFNPIYIPIILFITMGIWGEHINLTDTNGRAEAFLLFGWIIGAFLSEMHHDYKRKIEDRMNALLYTLKNE